MCPVLRAARGQATMLPLFNEILTHSQCSANSCLTRKKLLFLKGIYIYCLFPNQPYLFIPSHISPHHATEIALEDSAELSAQPLGLTQSLIFINFATVNHLLLKKILFPGLLS